MNIKDKLNKKNLIAIIASAVILVAILVGIIIWKAQPKGMVVAVSTLPDSLNPVLEQNTSGLNANELIFDGLVNWAVDSDGNHYPEYALAESIEQDEKTKKIYTVTLRETEWHDGTPVNSYDVLYSYQAYILEENDSPSRDYIMSFIDRVEVIDDKTLEIEFKNPIPEFSALPVLTFKIIPSRFQGHDMDTNLREGEIERKFATEPIGTGPFKLSSWEIGKWLTFDANGLYWKNTPQADSLVLKRVIDPIVRLNELRKGRVNAVLETNPMDHDKVANLSKVDINSFLPYAFYDVAINIKYFPKAEGRQAMAMALDRENLVPGITDNPEGCVLNYGVYPSNIFQIACPDYVNDPLPNLLQYDVKEAKKLAKKGGITDQNAILIYPDSMGDFGKKLAEGIAKQLNEIGLNVEVKRTGDQVYKRMIYKDKSYDLALMYHEGFDNWYSTIDTLYSTKSVENVTGVSDKQLESLFKTLAKQNLTEKRIVYIKDIYNRCCELTPSLAICTLRKDIYCRGIKDVAIATDNAFLSVEDWTFKE